MEDFRAGGAVTLVTAPAVEPGDDPDSARSGFAVPQVARPEDPLFARYSPPKQPANRSMNETIVTPSTNQSQMTQNHLRKPSPIKITQPQKMYVRARLGGGEHWGVASVTLLCPRGRREGGLRSEATQGMFALNK